MDVRAGRHQEGGARDERCLAADRRRGGARGRGGGPEHASAPTRLFNLLVMEPGSLVMERKMLLGIKERAERLAGARGQPDATAPARA